MVGSMGKRQVLAAAAGGAAALFAVGSMFLWGLWEAGGQEEPVLPPGNPSLSGLMAVTAPEAALPAPPAVSAASACVMTGSGKCLYEKDGDSFRPIASTTKIMTALLTLELGEGQLDEPFPVGDEVKVEGSALGIKPGAEVTLRLLVWGMLLSSGNDAAAAAAIRLGGSFEGFAELMNQKAAELGMENTHYVTPSGLDAEGQGSSARDLAVLACAALQNPEFRKVCGQTNGHMTVGGVEYWMSNHNRLLKEYDGCIGLKTGYTDAAGRCLVSAAERDGAVIVSVVLHDPEDWDDSAALLDWGFSALTPVTLKTDLSDVQIPVQSETGTALFYTVRPRSSLSAALASGESLCPVLSVRKSVPETARADDTAGMLRWVDGQGETRCWTALELDEPVSSPDASAPPGRPPTP